MKPEKDDDYKVGSKVVYARGRVHSRWGDEGVITSFFGDLWEVRFPVGKTVAATSNDLDPA